MKNYSILLFILAITGCSDGDLQIEALDFDNVVAQNCGALNTGTEIFFKINGDETLILDLQTGLLQNEVSTDTITSSIPNQSQLTYRLFSDNITSSYFCDSIPPTTPTVIEEIEATAGTILITTTTLDSVTFTHNIQFQGLILVNASGESIIDLTTNDFDSVDTSVN